MPGQTDGQADRQDRQTDRKRQTKRQRVLDSLPVLTPSRGPPDLSGGLLRRHRRGTFGPGTGAWGSAAAPAHHLRPPGRLGSKSHELAWGVEVTGEDRSGGPPVARLVVAIRDLGGMGH